mgnify:CR=1 FL=1
MPVTDPIADMLTSIRNAAQASHPRVDVPASRVKSAIADLLLREKYIENVRPIQDEKQGVLRIYLRYLPELGKYELAFADYNRRFHATLAQMSGNRRLAEETVRVMEFYDRLAIVSLTLLSREGGFDTPLADHNAIIDALQARNGRLAARLVRDHVERSRPARVRGSPFT